MTAVRAPKVVLLGMLSKIPVAGVVWQTIHYLVGFERLGYEAYYVEAHARTPSMLTTHDDDDGSTAAAALIGGVMDRLDMGDRWAFSALHGDGTTYGMSESRLAELYRDAALIINLHGGTLPRPEHAATGRLVYLETDPVTLQVELEHGVQSSIDFLEPHAAFFTFAENLGQPDCGLPVSERFPFRGTRQPVVLDMWEGDGEATGEVFTTVGNWQQRWRDVTYRGATYSWSKHHEFERFIDLPARTSQRFELALSGTTPEDVRRLERHGWIVIDGLAVSLDQDVYRDYITRSRAEFTVAKDQNVRLRSGWFSDRSATYLAAGKPVVTQDTAFDVVLPTGSGLFAYSSIDEIVDAVDRIASDLPAHSAAARAIARAYFSHDVVLGDLLSALGMPRLARRTSIPGALALAPVSRRPLVLPPETIAAAEALALGVSEDAAPSADLATVVIVTFENHALTRLCLDTVLANTPAGRYELIVVDNASIDDTREYLRAVSERHPHVRPIENPMNLGFAAACNQAIAAGRGDDLVLLNNDVLVPSGWLDGLLVRLRDPSIGAVGPVTNRIGTEAEIPADYADFAGFIRFAEDRGRSQRGRSRDVSTLAMFCFATRRDVYERIGPLDEQFGIGLLEDDDYAARLRAAGYRLVCAEDIFVHHFGEASFGALYASGAYHRLLTENKARYAAKWGMPWRPYARRPDEDYDDVIAATRRAIHEVVSPAMPALVVSRGDERLIDVEDRVTWHFPRDADGVWAGHYPADGAEAVALLLEQIDAGARYLVIPRTGLWWLQYYDRLGRHLDEHADVVHADAACRIFRFEYAPVPATALGPDHSRAVTAS
jgi:GT2 family glycosyltransferase